MGKKKATVRVHYEEGLNFMRAHGKEIRLSDLEHLIGQLSKAYGICPSLPSSTVVRRRHKPFATLW